MTEAQSDTSTLTERERFLMGVISYLYEQDGWYLDAEDMRAERDRLEREFGLDVSTSG